MQFHNQWEFDPPTLLSDPYTSYEAHPVLHGVEYYPPILHRDEYYPPIRETPLEYHHGPEYSNLSEV